MKNIVTIGGGNGQSILLTALKNYDCNISAIVSMVDNGGSTGKIRQDYNVLPSGDIRRCLIALAQDSQELKDVMAHRFETGFLQDHNFGNVLILALEKSLGSYEKAISYLSQNLNIKGQVIPVTLDKSHLIAKMEGGNIVEGETNIDVPQHDSNLKINKIYLEPQARANPKALKAIADADLIIYTIGDLYTSVIPNLLVSGVKEAINKSKAKKIYTCNRTTKTGETHGFTLRDFVQTLQSYLDDNSLDYILVDQNTDQPPQGYELVQPEEVKDVAVIQADLSTPEDRAHIDGPKLAKAINDLCQ